MSSSQCPENERLLNVFGDAVREVVMYQEQHFAALVSGEEDAERYELLIHVAGEKRRAAKYAYLTHIEEHGCERGAQVALSELATIRDRKMAARPERRKRNNPKITHRRRLNDF